MDKMPREDEFNEGERLTPEEKNLRALMSELNETVSQGDANRAEELLPQFWEALADQMDSEPDPVLDAYGLAHEKEWEGDWVGAEAAYREVLRLGLKDGRTMQVCKAHIDIASLYTLLDRNIDALEEAKLAVESVRQGDTFMLGLMALPCQINCALSVKDFELARASLDEWAAEGASNDLSKASQLIALAEWKMGTEDFSGAEADLIQARELVEPMSAVPGMAGYQNALARCWRLHARLLQVHGHQEEAVQEMWKAIQCRRNVSQMPQLEGPYKFNALAVALGTYAKMCREMGNEEAALEAKTESDEIRRWIHLAPLPD